MRYLLDSNTCIAAMRKHPRVIQRMAGTSRGDCAISTITSYELFTGVEKCANPVRERAKVYLLINTLLQIPFDTAAAEEAARIRAHLESLGQPIGSYDTLLAGQALALALIMVTANVSEFSRVPGLTVENWQA
ncbi:MAG: PIN domain-containing protein [Planctomycetes bacterium]|nr:PIN domain-containing protein [Planctomycetota bacterium]